MAEKSKIEWTDSTWNPISGCTKISPGCDNCYAHAIAERFRGTGAYPNGFDVTVHEDRFSQPERWRQPRRIFVNSMSDMFHKDVVFHEQPILDILFDVMERARHHTYQILTKRSSLMMEYINKRYGQGGRRKSWNCPGHIHLGVSVEDAAMKSRLEHLRNTNAITRFVSIEPLLGDPGIIDLTGIRWVIVGGESGRSARPMNPDWARSVRDQCHAAGVAFFMKQMSKREPIPDDLMIREFPQPIGVHI